jgi:hypothetical protein
MIFPAYSMTAAESVLPALALDFTTGVLDPRVSFIRSGNTATVTNSNGVIVGINANLPRFDFDPVTLACRGLLIEETRTNALLNSLIDGTSLATQTVSVTAAARTLSFYGTGQVVLSGAASATITGSGAYPTRTTYTFTPAAGNLTLTVTGTVQFAQLELGAFATSFIPTAGTAFARNVDDAFMTGTNFSSWFNATEGTVVVRGSRNSTTSFSAFVSINNGGATQEMYVLQQGTTAQSYIRSSGSAGDLVDTATWPVGSVGTVALAYKANNCALSYNANALVLDNAVGIPAVTQMQIGNRFGTRINGHIASIEYYKQRLTNPEIQAFSKG